MVRDGQAQYRESAALIFPKLGSFTVNIHRRHGFILEMLRPSHQHQKSGKLSGDDHNPYNRKTANHHRANRDETRSPTKSADASYGRLLNIGSATGKCT